MVTAVTQTLQGGMWAWRGKIERRFWVRGSSSSQPRGLSSCKQPTREPQASLVVT